MSSAAHHMEDAFVSSDEERREEVISAYLNSRKRKQKRLENFRRSQQDLFQSDDDEVEADLLIKKRRLKTEPAPSQQVVPVITFSDNRSMSGQSQPQVVQERSNTDSDELLRKLSRVETLLSRKGLHLSELLGGRYNLGHLSMRPSSFVDECTITCFGSTFDLVRRTQEFPPPGRLDETLMVQKTAFDLIFFVLSPTMRVMISPSTDDRHLLLHFPDALRIAINKILFCLHGVAEDDPTNFDLRAAIRECWESALKKKFDNLRSKFNNSNRSLRCFVPGWGRVLSPCERLAVRYRKENNFQLHEIIWKSIDTIISDQTVCSV